MSEIIVGKPSASVIILYHKSLSRDVRNIDTDSRQICGIIIYYICVVSVYMICDKYSNVTMNDEYVNDIDDIEYLMHENECNALIITCDFNTCYVRNNAQTRTLLEFEDRNDLLNAWQNSNAVRDYTYINHSLSHRSCIKDNIVPGYLR